jgi:hypothetical protein
MSDVTNPLLFAMDRPIQVAGSALALEHALIMLLLLVGFLSIRGQQRRYVSWVVLAGIGLSLFTPIHTLEPAWPFMAWRNWLAWLPTVLLIALALNVGGRVPPASALLLGILAVSLMWQVRERATGSTDLGTFGLLTLALLLAEVDLTLHSLGSFLGTLFSGAGLGLLLGYSGVRIAFRLPDGEIRNLFCLGLAYLAYLAGVLIGTSGVVTAAMTGLMVAVYGYSAGLWPTTATLPAPLNRRGIFLLMAATWLLLGWEAHVPLIAAHITGIILGIVAAAVGILVGRRVAPVSGGTAQSLPQALLRKKGKVLLLLSGAVLLWPQKVVLDPWPLALALLAALLALLILRLVLNPVFDLMGIELRLPDETTLNPHG